MDHIKQLVAECRQDPSQRPELFRVVCKEIVERLGTTRASIWSFTRLQEEIVCECLYDERDGSFSQGTRLAEDDFRDYFQAIKQDLKVVAPDAFNHAATRCFNKAYFTPLDIRSLLDFVILVDDEPVGVLCCEHCAEIKRWSDSDMALLHTMSALIGMALKPMRTNSGRMPAVVKR